MVDVVNQGHAQAPSGGVSQGLYESSTTQKGPLGALLELNDGRRFRYGHAVAAVAAGKLSAQDISVTGVAALAAKWTNSAGTSADQAVGAERLYLLDTDTWSTADAKDVYAGGYVHITNLGGEGHTYKVRGNAQGTAAGLMAIDIYDGVAVQIDSESSVAITGATFRNQRLFDDGTDVILGGVANVAIGAGEYGWFQTRGERVCFYDGDGDTAAIGAIAQASFGDAGAVQQLGSGIIDSEDDLPAATKAPIVGYFMAVAAADADYAPIMLTIE